MGKFLNTTYHDSVENITDMYQNLVNNPFYQYSDKKPTIVTYYNINTDFSSLDPGSKLYMDNIGSESPIKYNRIYDTIIYGFNRIELNNNVGDFGVEADDIEGDCYILPNTFIPTENDYFEVSHIKDSTWLFIVKDVQKDTLPNGSNVYKLSYKLEYADNSQILNNIVYNFRMITSPNGTNISTIVRCEDYDIAKKMDEVAVKLKGYYCDLFYSNTVQTFIFMDLTEWRVYDPFLIEFLIRNKILDNGENSYVYVTHQIPVVKTFSMDYDRTIFRCFELKDKDKLLSSMHDSGVEDIRAYGTTFYGRYEPYFKVSGIKSERCNVSMIDENLIIDILEGQLYTEQSEIWKNIIVKYFLDMTYTEEEIEAVNNINFKFSSEAFYMIPYLIFCIEKAIENVLKQH
jgi:hypothetical protein